MVWRVGASRLLVPAWCSTLPYAPGSSLRRNCGVDCLNDVDFSVLQRSWYSARNDGSATAAAGTSSAAFGVFDPSGGSRRDRQVVFSGRISRVSSRGLSGACQDRERFPAVRFWCRRSSLYIPVGWNTATAPL